MASRSGPANAARFVAGALAALWGMRGLTLAYPFISLYGPHAAVIAAIVVNVALVASAALAFVDAPRWRASVIVALLLVTAERLIYAGTAALAVVIDVAVLLAIGAVVFLSTPPKKPAT